MMSSAIMLHEWFMSLLGAGFSEDQALRLIAASMSANRGEPEH